MTMTNIISIKNFRMQFGKSTVIKDLSFDVKRGETFGFLVSNYSGKTTTILAILVISQPTSGYMLIVGKSFTVQSVFELVPDGQGCLYRIRYHDKVNVPLLGGVVEKFILGQTEQGCADELDYLAKFVEKAR